MTPRQVAALFDRRNDAVRDTERLADHRAGVVAATVYNMQRDMKKDPRGRDWLHFFPHWREPAPVQSEDQMFGNMQAWVKATERRRAASA